MKQKGSLHTEREKNSRWLPWAVLALILLLALALRFYRLDTPSYTWDEATDREIAHAYLLGNGLTMADREYSQARLPIYLETLVIKYWGDSEFKLRTIAVIAGAISLIVIWRLGKQVFGSPVGLIAAAIAAFNPFHLLISRLSGTHGDAPLTLFYALSLLLFINFWENWRQRGYAALNTADGSRLLLFGLAAGLATASKLSGAMILANLLLVLVVGRRRWRSVIPWLTGVAAIWLAAFLLASPIYLRPENVIAAWQEQMANWEQIRGFQFMGRVYEELPLWYWAVVLPLKFTLPVTLAWLFQIAHLIRRWARTTARERILLFNHFPLLVLLARNWQSPTYAAVLVGPIFVLAGRSLVQWGRAARRAWKTRRWSWQRLLALIALLLVVVETGRVIAITHPDYLMTGYDFGDPVIGQFWGPAVFHCQGAGQAMEYVAHQPEGPILTPNACTIMIGYYQIVYDLPEITFQSQMERPEDVLDYRYVLLGYNATYMRSPYPLFQDTAVLREGVNRYCESVYAYGLRNRDLFWVYECGDQP